MLDYKTVAVRCWRLQTRKEIQAESKISLAEL